MPATETITAMDGLFVLKQCLNCNYSLIGLPREGKCPECGHEYDQEVILVDGWGRGRKSNLLTGPRRDTLQLAFMALAPSALFAFVAAFVTGASRFYGWLSLATAVPPLAFLAFKLSQPDLVRPSEVLLNSAGCSQATRRPTRSSIADALIRFSVGSKDTYRHRRVSWIMINQVRIWRNNSGRVRLRCEVGSWWNRMAPVDFEFIASPADAAELQRRIEVWQSTAVRNRTAT